MAKIAYVKEKFVLLYAKTIEYQTKIVLYCA